MPPTPRSNIQIAGTTSNADPKCIIKTRSGHVSKKTFFSERGFSKRSSSYTVRSAQKKKDEPRRTFRSVFAWIFGRGSNIELNCHSAQGLEHTFVELQGVVLLQHTFAGARPPARGVSLRRHCAAGEARSGDGAVRHRWAPQREGARLPSSGSELTLTYRGA